MQMKKAEPELNIERLCQLFNLAASTYYYQHNEQYTQHQL